MLSMPSWGHNISGLMVEVVRSSPSWRGNFRGRSFCSRRLWTIMHIQICFLSMKHCRRYLPSYGMPSHSLIGQASFRRLWLATYRTPQSCGWGSFPKWCNRSLSSSSNAQVPWSKRSSCLFSSWHNCSMPCQEGSCYPWGARGEKVGTPSIYQVTTSTG